MQFERINENQIRCTLTPEDLLSRNLNLRDLAYGSEQTRELFQEMISEAAAKLGFDLEDMPLMIEAIPLATGNLMLLITRVDDPEELDTRFSRFTPTNEPADSAPEEPLPPFPAERADDISKQSLIYTFPTLDAVTEAAVSLQDSYFGVNSLYKDERTGIYYLTVSRSGHSQEEFLQTCNQLAEYGSRAQSVAGTEAYLEEHCKILVSRRALQVLGSL